MKTEKKKGHLYGTKRLLALLMSLCMIATMMPITAKAEETTANETVLTQWLDFKLERKADNTYSISLGNDVTIPEGATLLIGCLTDTIMSQGADNSQMVEGMNEVIGTEVGKFSIDSESFRYKDVQQNTEFTFDVKEDGNNNKTVIIAVAGAYNNNYQMYDDIYYLGACELPEIGNTNTNQMTKNGTGGETTDPEPAGPYNVTVDVKYAKGCKVTLGGAEFIAGTEPAPVSVTPENGKLTMVFSPQDGKKFTGDKEMDHPTITKRGEEFSNFDAVWNEESGTWSVTFGPVTGDCTLWVDAKAVDDESGGGSTDPKPAPKYNVTVQNGTTSDTSYEAGATVTITANAPDSGKEFDHWEVVSGEVTLADANNATTTFTMPANAVEVKAVYKDIPHTHQWSDGWTHSGTHHWHECEGSVGTCDKVNDADKDGYSEHSYDNDEDTTCDTCGYERTVTPPTPSHTHAWSGEWTHNTTHHWHECTAAGCDVSDNAAKDGYGSHSYDNDEDTTCNDCGYVRELTPPESHTHAWSDGWTHSGTHHWHECGGAGTCDITDNAGKDGYGEHDYTDDTDTTCDTCGYERTVTPPTPSHTHAWSGEWKHNTTHHWHECTAAGCDVSGSSEKDGYATHSFGEWKVTKEATETEAGSRTHSCTECGYEETESIPATGGSGGGSTEPTPTPDPTPKPTPDPTPDPKPDTGDLEKDNEIAEGAPETVISSDKEQLKKTDILTEAEKARIENGEQAKIWIKVDPLNEQTVPAGDKEQTEQAALEKVGKDAKITYLDLTLWKKVGSDPKTQIFNVNNKIQVTITVPDGIRNTDPNKTRTYYIIRVHDGKAEVIEGTYNKDTGEFTFATDRFSTYAIVYKDTANQEPPQDTDTDNDNPAQPPEDKKDTPKDNTGKPDDVPKTGDTSHTGMWFMLMLVSGMGAFIFGRRRKESAK